jgi:adenine-specific DNA-methyltransferase
MSKEEKITNNIKVPNKDLETLRINFPHCFDKDGNFQLEKFKANLTEKEINFSTESYGIDWLGKSYARLLASDPATTLLKADETHNSKPENANSENLIIKGDNLEVLKHLTGAYYEKVKMIYIDPPYNTGSDGFVYDDDRKFTVKELQQLIGVDAEKAKRILDFTQSKSNSHSAWLTFMYPRLYIAKQLLREDGVIFVSIDDNEVAQLRLLMDEVFGEENFFADMIVIRAEGGGLAKRVIKGHDNLLVYIRNLSIFGGIYKPKDIRGKIVTIDNKEYWIEEDWLRKEFGKYGTCLYEEILEIKGEEKKKEIDDGLKKGIYTLIQKNGGHIVGRLRALDEDGTKFYSILKHLNKNGVEDLEKLDMEKYFDFPKPVSLIKELVLGATIFSKNENDIILDFFAGSGTTGDAVMQLNVEDSGNRKYILVQLPEAIDPKKNKTAYDFVKNDLKVDEPTIFEITKERLIRSSRKTKEEIVNKKITEIKKEIKELEGKLDLDYKDEKIKLLHSEIKSLKEQNLAFKIYETTPIWEDYNFEAEQFDSSQTLFDAGKLTEADIKALLVTWKTNDNISLSQELEIVDLCGYTAFYGQGKLYLLYKNFTTENLKAVLEKIDTDKTFNPTSIIAFGYHFESKSLRELSENVKQYANKKKIDIDFITRY